MVKVNSKSNQQYTHYDLLSTVEDMYGLSAIGRSQYAKDITASGNKNRANQSNPGHPRSMVLAPLTADDADLGVSTEIRRRAV